MRWCWNRTGLGMLTRRDSRRTSTMLCRVWKTAWEQCPPCCGLRTARCNCTLNEQTVAPHGWTFILDEWQGETHQWD